MNILLTGASGFLGSQIKLVCEKKNSVKTIGRQASNDIECDLSKNVPVIDDIDAVIHAAGKAHVYPTSAVEIKEFFDVNVEGTKLLLTALETSTIQKFVFISSVSVYGLGQGELINEDTPLDGKAPYALSKIQAEEIIETWSKQKNIDYLILRLPLIVGPNPLGNLGKMIKAIEKGRYVRIAKGDAKKSMVLASDVAMLISNWLSDKKAVSGIYNLTDAYHPTFYELEEALKWKFNKKNIPTIPLFIAKWMGKFGDYVSFFPVNSGTIKKITSSFTFSDAKAKKELGWNPTSVLEYYKEC